MRAERAVILIAGAAALITVVRVAAFSGGDGSPPGGTEDVRGARFSYPADAEQLTLSQVVTVLRAAGWPEHAIPEAVDVVACESSWRPAVIGTSGERGLFQIHPIHDHRFDLAGVMRDPTDPVHNAAVALAIWKRYGWQPWSCQPWN